MVLTRKDKLRFDKMLAKRQLSQTEEALLAERIKAGDASAVSILVEHNLRFVHFFLTHHVKMRPDHNLFHDCFSEGVYGMLIAAYRFNPKDNNVKFCSYAVWWLRQSIFGWLRNATTLKITTAEVAKLRKNLIEDAKSESEINRIAKLSDTKLAHSLDNAVASLDSAKQNSVNLYEYIEDNSSLTDMIEQIATDDTKRIISLVLAKLGPFEQDVVVRYLGLEGHEKESLCSIGSTHGLSRERIRQIKDRALNRLTSIVMNDIKIKEALT